MPTIPPLDQLDPWIAEKERRFTVRPGSEAGVVWAGARVRTPFSIIYLHGYSASRGELYPVPDRVAQALGANLFYARLAGHAVTPDGHASVTLNDWFADAETAWAVGQALGERVILMGCSTGVTLASWLVLGPLQARPAASVFVSPNLGLKNRLSELLLWPGRETLLRWLLGETHEWKSPKPGTERAWDVRRATKSLIVTMDLVKAVRKFRVRDWPSPVLVVYDTADDAAEPKLAVRYFRRTPQTRFVVWDAAPGDNHHVLAGDIQSPSGTEPLITKTLEFLKPLI